MNWLNRKILYIDLEHQSFEFKNESTLGKYIGGIGMSAKLMHDLKDPKAIILSVGPLSGFFPFASKTSVSFFSDKYVDAYLGGTLSSRIRFAGIDAIVLLGKSKDDVVLEISNEAVAFKSSEIDLGMLGFPGKRSTITFSEGNVLHNDYFESLSKESYTAFKNKNISAMVISGVQTFKIENRERYNEIYQQILKQTNKITAEKRGNPSCFGCPMGCDKSKHGELGGDVLVHSLVGCEFASTIYKDQNIVFSCLNLLGYGYTHEDIENFPQLVYDVLENLK